MKILLTNDDGVQSEGLFALWAALSPLHEVAVIAPDRNWSIAGHNKTMDRPLRVTERQWEGTTVYASDGTPSDCVALAALGFLGWRPDLVVSGINKGPNLGDDITYSGTVAHAVANNRISVTPIHLDLTNHHLLDVIRSWDLT